MTMRLLSFQVKDCFGFHDSGVVNLQDPSNLIYVLGRNSSGKSAFLSALGHFSPRRDPQSDPRFRNFDPSTRQPRLIAQFDIGDHGISVEALADAFVQTLRRTFQGDPSLFSSDEFQRYLKEVPKAIIKEFATWEEASKSSGALWMVRHSSGAYSFSFKSDFSDAKTWEQHAEQVLANALTVIRRPGAPGENQVLIAGSWRAMSLPTFAQLTETLARQLPNIEWLTGKQSALPLDGDLPNALINDHLSGNQSPLTEAFIDYLGREKVREDLTTQNPARQRKIEAEMQSSVFQLATTINRNTLGVQALLKIDLKRSDGLQITFERAISHRFTTKISENTKFLFAYYLYRAVGKLQGSILLFDEPNNGFHATAQEQLLNFLKSLGQEGNLVIVSTHSEHLIDPDYLTGIRLMDGDKNGYLRVLNHWHDHPTGDGNFLSLQPVLDAIGLKYGTSKLTIHDNVIVVEGITEWSYLHAFHRLRSTEGPAFGTSTRRRHYLSCRRAVNFARASF